MRIRFFTWMCMVVCGILAGIAYADNAEDTVSLVDSAVNTFMQQGDAAAIKALNDPQGPFMKGEICVFAMTMDNVLVGHPINVFSKRINLSDVEDSSGVLIFEKFKEIVQKDGSGWVEYLWGKPCEDIQFLKRSFVKKVPDKSFYVGASYYLK